MHQILNNISICFLLVKLLFQTTLTQQLPLQLFAFNEQHKQKIRIIHLGVLCQKLKQLSRNLKLQVFQLAVSNPL